MSEDIVQRALASPDLPSLPGAALEILRLARDPNASVRKLTDVVSTDSALTSKILRTVNSALYALRHPVSTLSRAVVVLGTNGVRTLTLGFTLAGSIRKSAGAGVDLDVYWRRSVYAAVSARAICDVFAFDEHEEASLAALMQDIGMLGLRAALGEKYEQLPALADEHERLAALERTEYGVDHADMGARMAEHWQLPPLLATPVAFHHRPEQAPADLARITRVVALSRQLANVFLAEDVSGVSMRAREHARTLLGMEPGQVESALQRTSRSLEDVSEVFEVTVDDPGQRERILGQARDALLDMTLQSQQVAHQLQEQNKQLQQVAHTDPLTGLANRACLDETLPALFSTAVRTRAKFAVLFLDADHFKQVNDTFGHAAGDEVLRRLADIVSAICGEEGLVVRYGGEEIVCVVPDLGLRGAAALGESIRQAVEQAVIEHDGKTIPVTVSLGVAAMETPRDFESPQQLIAAADAAVYAAKSAGRNAVRTAEPVHS